MACNLLLVMEMIPLEADQIKGTDNLLYCEGLRILDSINKIHNNNQPSK